MKKVSWDWKIFESESYGYSLVEQLKDFLDENKIEDFKIIILEDHLMEIIYRIPDME